MIGIVVAMEKEANIFLKESKIISKQTIAGKCIVKGNFADTNFILIIGGIGKVNASMSTQILIDKYAPDYILNFGVAGAKSRSNLNAGDMVIVSEVCQYDFDLSEIDDVDIGYMQDYNTIYYPTAYAKYKGNMLKQVKCATGDRFTKQEYFLNIISNLGADVVDMECGAIAEVCLANNVPLYILKLISDVDGKEESVFAQYANNVESICKKIPNGIFELLQNIE